MCLRHSNDNLGNWPKAVFTIQTFFILNHFPTYKKGRLPASRDLSNFGWISKIAMTGDNDKS